MKINFKESLMTAKLIVIAYATIITLLVSMVGALPSLFWGFSICNYLAWVFIITAVQLFIGKLWNYFIDRNHILEMEKIQTASLVADAIQYIQLACAYCGTNNMVKILLAEENSFKCEACEQINGVVVHTTCTRKTNPIMPKAEVAEIFKNIDKKK